MDLIGAWIFDPQKSLLGKKGDKARLFKLSCSNPSGCEIYTKCGSCLHTMAMRYCKHGQKTEATGYTRRAAKYHDWMRKAREIVDAAPTIKSLKAFSRIFRVQGEWYLPYPFMAEGTFSGQGYALKSEWVPVNQMTAELLARICMAKPRAFMGDVIPDYQKKSVPKLIADLKMHYPELFDLLPDDQKARAENIDYRKRKADITTCAPGAYKFGSNIWQWDGERLRSKSMLFQPCPGDLEITLKPKPGSPVEITDNAQVTPETVFLD